MLKKEPCHIPDHAARYRRKVIDSFANRKHLAIGTLIGRPYPFRLMEEWETSKAYDDKRETAEQEEIFSPSETFPRSLERTGSTAMAQMRQTFMTPDLHRNFRRQVSARAGSSNGPSKMFAGLERGIRI